MYLFISSILTFININSVYLSLHTQKIKSYAWKLRKNGISCLFVIERGYGKICMASIGWPASTPDISCFKKDPRFNTRQKRNNLFAKVGSIIGDSGFFDQSIPGFCTPIAHTKTAAGRNRWRHLSDEEKEWSRNVSKCEVVIENIFATIFYNRYQLLRRRPQPNVRSGPAGLSKLIHGAAILHNLDIEYNNKRIFDGEDWEWGAIM